MRKSIRIPAVLALSLALAVPALAQSTHQHPAPAAAASADAAKTAPAVDKDKAYLLHQEYIAKTAELRGKIAARQAELETLLATKPDDTAAVKKLTAELGAMRGQLFEQTTLFRIRYAKETGTPMRMTRGFGHMDGMMMGMDHDMKAMDHATMPGMDHGAMPGMDHAQHNMAAPAAPADAAKTNQ